MIIGGSIKLPESCIKVLGVLKSFSNNGASQQQIIEETRLSERAVKYAVKRLELSGAVSAAYVISDLRRKMFYIGGEKNGNK